MGVTTITVDAMYVAVSIFPGHTQYLSISRLFDMDGTLVDSTKGVVGAWHTFHEKYPQLNVEEILNSKPYIPPLLKATYPGGMS